VSNSVLDQISQICLVAWGLQFQVEFDRQFQVIAEINLSSPVEVYPEIVPTDLESQRLRESLLKWHLKGAL
jgi:hypothetical protein